MGKLKEFDITFTNNKVVYSPGESISGSVKITTGTSLQYKGKITYILCMYHWLNEAHQGSISVDELNGRRGTFPLFTWPKQKITSLKCSIVCFICILPWKIGLK